MFYPTLTLLPLLVPVLVPFFPFLIFSLLFFVFFPIVSSLTRVCVVIRTTCTMYVVVFSGVASGVQSVFQAWSVRRMDLAHRRQTPDFTFFFLADA